MFCKNCGHEITNGDMFCASCGWKVENEENAQSKTALQNELKYIDDDSPTVRLSPSDVVTDDSPTVKLEQDEPATKPDVNEYSGTQQPVNSNANQTVTTPAPYYSGTNTAVNNNKQKNKYAVPIVICSFVFAIVAFLMIAFCFNLFGFKTAVAEIINGDGTSQSEETDEEDETKEAETSTEPTTQETTTESTTQIIYGTPDNPIIINGAQKNISAQIVSQGQCNLKFSPSQTGYYYIQVPVGYKVVTFKTYDNAGNLMGNCEHHKEGNVNEYLYYDMFYAGETYTIVAAGDSGYGFNISFTNRTNDAHRFIYSYLPVKLTSKYTYLRTFTPEKTGNFTLYATPASAAGTIRLFDSNWNDMNYSFSNDGYGNVTGEVYLEKGKKYHFVFYPSGNVQVTIGPSNTGGM